MGGKEAAPVSWSLDRREDLYAVVDGLRVRHWDVGAGSPVVLVHGLGASVESWLPNVEALAERHRVLALDLPGFGRSAKEGLTYSASFAASFVAAFLDAMGAGRASVVGNSMGGLVALQLALDHPERVDRLVLVSSAGLGREVGFYLRLAALPLLGDYLASLGTPEAVVRATISSILSNPHEMPRELIDRWVELTGLPGASAAFVKAARAGLSIFGQRRQIVLRHRLAEVRAPTLIVWGDEDPVIPVAHAYAAHRRLPCARLHVFKGCRHCPQLERPAEFNELVLEFLGEGQGGIPPGG